MEFKNLEIGFGSKKILSNLTGELKRGELVALMGINGVGKSCFIKSLSRIIPLISGTILLDKTDIQSYTQLEIAKKMAIVLTDKIQVDYLKVGELLLSGRSVHTNYWGTLKKEDQQAVDEVAQLLNIAPLMDNFFQDLSDGQKQKVLLGRALVQNPEYLFLDEPTTYLDIPSKIELMKTLRYLSKEKNISVFFSTHDLALVEKDVDALWLIDNEKNLHKKSPEEMIRSGLLQKNFNLNF
jgi:iron complex transport system ATP-binding protein